MWYIDVIISSFKSSLNFQNLRELTQLKLWCYLFHFLLEILSVKNTKIKYSVYEAKCRLIIILFFVSENKWQWYIWNSKDHKNPQARQVIYLKIEIQPQTCHHGYGWGYSRLVQELTIFHPILVRWNSSVHFIGQIWYFTTSMARFTLGTLMAQISYMATRDGHFLLSSQSQDWISLFN